MDAGSSSSGRRAYDRDIDPVIAMAIDAVVADTRHLLRNEFTAAMLDLSNKISALGKSVTEGNFQSAAEHAEVKAKLDTAITDIGELKELAPRVSSLESEDMADERASKAVVELRKWMLGLAGLIVAAASVLAAVVHH